MLLGGEFDVGGGGLAVLVRHGEDDVALRVGAFHVPCEHAAIVGVQVERAVEEGREVGGSGRRSVGGGGGRRIHGCVRRRQWVLVRVMQLVVLVRAKDVEVGVRGILATVHLPRRTPYMSMDTFALRP